MCTLLHSLVAALVTNNVVDDVEAPWTAIATLGTSHAIAPPACFSPLHANVIVVAIGEADSGVNRDSSAELPPQELLFLSLDTLSVLRSSPLPEPVTRLARAPEGTLPDGSPALRAGGHDGVVRVLGAGRGGFGQTLASVVVGGGGAGEAVVAVDKVGDRCLVGAVGRCLDVWAVEWQGGGDVSQ